VTVKRAMDLTILSKRISRILRHRPDAAGVRLDKHGWCDVDDLLQGLARAGTPATREQLEQMVRGNDKQRFVLEGNRIRAAQGHSIPGVEPLLRSMKPPSRLFHGTVAANLPSIDCKGLLPMRRHHVHLSTDEASARAVGGRRGVPIVLVVDAARMDRDGHKFFVSDNGVWLTDNVPSKYLSRLQDC
jgi:putative RNA 2'-phosphotransferase